MSGNSFGNKFVITTFGESHGEGIGVVIDGFPGNLIVDVDDIQRALDKRRPGQSQITTQRNEEDKVEVLSGIFEGKSTGAPITLFIKNKQQISKDYDAIKNVYRPSHGDFTWDVKFGHRDYRGGGRLSARETAARVAAGALAKIILDKHHITVTGYVSQIHHISLPKDYVLDTNFDLESNPVRCPNPFFAKEMEDLILSIKEEGDSVGGVVSCVIKNCPIGLGNPVFDKLEADLAKAMLSINATKGFDIGEGFDSVLLKGSEMNDEFIHTETGIRTKTNRSGGIQGGISNGEDINFRVAFKPVSSIKKSQDTVDKEGNLTTISVEGRHDPCVVPRAVPIVEAMAQLVIADFLIQRYGEKMS